MADHYHRGTQLPVEGGEQIVVQEITIVAHVAHELGHVSTLPGEHHFRGGVINRRAHFVTGA